MKYYANVIDLSELPDSVLVLVMGDWFDRDDVIVSDKQVDDIWVRICGESEEVIKERVDMLKSQKAVRCGGGVRIRKVRRSTTHR